MRWLRRRGNILFLAIFLLPVAFGLASNTAAAENTEPLVVAQVTDNAYDDQAPMVFGNRLVWQGLDGSDSEVFTWSVGDAEPIQLTDNGSMDRNPQVCGNRVVWEGSDDTDSEIYTWTPDTGVVRLTDNDCDDYRVRLSADRVVWQSFNGPENEIFTWALGDTAPTRLTDNAYDDSYPMVSGHRVVWEGFDGADYEVFSWTPTEGTRQLTDNIYDDKGAWVSADRVVWRGLDGSDYEIFTWAAGDTAPTRLTDNAYDDSYPMVCEERVAWEGFDGADYEVFSWTPTEGTRQLTDNTYDDKGAWVSIDRIAWLGFDGCESDIFMWTPTAGTTQLTDNAYNDSYPLVSGARMVWYAPDADGDYEIFTAAPGSLAVTVTAPDSGSTSGGTRVHIVGMGFTGASAVLFGDVNASALTVSSDTEMTVTSPAHAPGRVHVRVVTPDGVSPNTPANAFCYYVGAPTVAGLDPAAGPTEGGTSVTITGTNFLEVKLVSFDGIAALDYTVDSDTQITATAPAHVGGAAQVQVVAAGGVSADVSSDDYRYADAPTVAGISPSTGPTDGGTSVTITGANFVDVKGVFFARDHVSSFTVDSPTQITVTSPPWWWSGPVHVQVATPGGASAETPEDGFTYAAPPPEELFEVVQLTDDANAEADPQVSGERVVWSGFDGSDYEIFTWTSTTGTVQLTENDYADSHPQVSGERVVWSGFDGLDCEIFTWTPSKGIVQLTDNDYDEGYPTISNDHVVWFGSDGVDCEVFTWTPSGGASQITNNDQDDVHPKVSGQRVVWEGFDGCNWQIFTWTPVGGIVQVTNDASDALAMEAGAQVSGDRVVWQGFDGMDDEIFCWTPIGGITQLTENETPDVAPQMSEDRIAWFGFNGNDSGVLNWTPSEGVVMVSTAGSCGIPCTGLSGDRVVWSGSSPDLELATWTPTKGNTQLTSNDYDDSCMQVAGNRVVWLSYDGSRTDVFTASTLATPPSDLTIVDAGPPGGVDEGSPYTADGSFLDPDSTSWTATVDYGDGSGAQPLVIDPQRTFSLSHPYADDGAYTVSVTVTDEAGGAVTVTATVTVRNVAPTIGVISGPLNPQQVGATVSLGFVFDDPGLLDTHTWQVTWGDDGASTGVVAGHEGAAEHVYSEPGIYTPLLVISDDDGGSATRGLGSYVVVYDPGGGFVTGGGWIDSPVGAYAPDPSLSGKASFGFVSKYLKGTMIPTGNTEFQFKVAGFTFRSTSYDWLVVAGAKAKYKGTGAVNGAGDYGFMLSAIDGDLLGGGKPDCFRIKIWDETTGQTIYDNQMGDSEDADAATVLGGGSIVVHKSDEVALTSPWQSSDLAFVHLGLLSWRAKGPPPGGSGVSGELALVDRRSR